MKIESTKIASGSSSAGETNGLTPVKNTTGIENAWFGYRSAVTANNLTGIVALGAYATVTASNMAVIGGKTVALLQLGSDSSDTQTTRVIRGAGARGGTDTNTAGSSLAIGGGLSTGTGTPGSVLLQVATAGSTGTAANTLATYMELAPGGDLKLSRTITTAGTTGNQTINKMAGTGNIAAAGTTVTVTNSFCTTSSIVHAVLRTNDATARLVNVVPGSGSFVINIVACTAETSIGFWITD